MNRIDTYGFSGVFVCSLNSSRRGLLAICSFALPESIIHQTVPQSDGIFGFRENHRVYLYPVFALFSINANINKNATRKFQNSRG